MQCPLGARWDFTHLDSESGDGAASEFWSRVYHNIKQASRKVSREYNRGRKPHNFRVVDTVLFRLKQVSSKAREVSAKMSIRWSEMVVIAKEIWPNVVLLAHPDTGVIMRRAHVAS
jgi:hypothetical protein